MNVLAIQRSWGKEIKKLNKRVELKHTSLNLTKTLGLFWRALPEKQDSVYFEGEKNREPTLSPTRSRRQIFGGNEDGSDPNCSQIMPFHIRGNYKTLE